MKSTVWMSHFGSVAKYACRCWEERWNKSRFKYATFLPRSFKTLIRKMIRT